MPRGAEAGCRQPEGACGAAQSEHCLLSPSSGFPAGQPRAPESPTQLPSGVCAPRRGARLHPLLRAMSSPPGERALRRRAPERALERRNVAFFQMAQQSTWVLLS